MIIIYNINNNYNDNKIKNYNNNKINNVNVNSNKNYDDNVNNNNFVYETIVKKLKISIIIFY